MTEIHHLLKTAEHAALEAGKAVMRVYSSGDFSSELKAGEFPVTIADKKSHAILTKLLQPTGFPVLSEEGSNIDFSTRESWEYFWLIDPLDGTKEFINKNGEFTINIALMLKSKPVAGVVYAPCIEALYGGSLETGVFKIESGKRLQFEPRLYRENFHDLQQKQQIRIVASRSHMSNETINFINQFPHFTLKSLGSSLKFMLLLENDADVYPRLEPTMEWDTAAAHAILNASNRGVYQTDLQSELIYNKPELRNPFFIAF